MPKDNIAEDQPTEQSSTKQSNFLRQTLVVASDLHLTGLDDRRGALLLDVLARISTDDVELVVLNGDIFDFCLGTSSYFQQKFAALGEALSKLCTGGVRVILVEGNHDFHLDGLEWVGVEVVKEQNIDLVVGHTQIRFSHGDLIRNDRLYRIFRKVVKSKFVAAAASWLPGRWLDRYALGHAKISRASDRYRQLDHHGLLGDCETWMADLPVAHGILGHFHVPYYEDRQTGRGKLICVESWDNPNILCFDSVKFSRVYLAEPGQPFLLQPPQSYMTSQA